MRSEGPWWLWRCSYKVASGCHGVCPHAQPRSSNKMYRLDMNPARRSAGGQGTFCRLSSDLWWYSTEPQVRSTRPALMPASSISHSVSTELQAGPRVPINLVPVKFGPLASSGTSSDATSIPFKKCDFVRNLGALMVYECTGCVGDRSVALDRVQLRRPGRSSRTTKL